MHDFYTVRDCSIQPLKKAIADFSKAIELDNSYTNAYYFRAMLYHRIRKKDEYIVDYQKDIQLSPDSQAGRLAQRKLEIMTSPDQESQSDDEDELF